MTENNRNMNPGRFWKLFQPQMCLENFKQSQLPIIRFHSVVLGTDIQDICQNLFYHDLACVKIKENIQY